MTETPLAFFQIIEKLRSGEGVVLGGRQNQKEVSDLVNALPLVVRLILKGANQAHDALVAHAVRNIKPGFLLQQTPPSLRISVSEWNPGEVRLQQPAQSPTTNKDWNAYRVQARAVMPDAYSRAAKTNAARELTEEERAHAQVNALYDIPFTVGIDVYRHGVGGYVSSELPLGMIPPAIIAQVSLAPEHPSRQDFYNTGIALLAHEGQAEELSPVIESPGFEDFAFHLGDAVDLARHTLLNGMSDGINPNNPPFINEHNRGRLFDGIADLLKNL